METSYESETVEIYITMKNYSPNQQDGKRIDRKEVKFPHPPFRGELHLLKSVMRLNFLLFVLLTMATSTTQAVLVAHLKFNDNLNDETTSHNGTAIGVAPVFDVGRIGNAVRIDGLFDQVIELANPSSINMSNDFTITCWVKTSESDPENTVFYKGPPDAFSQAKQWALSGGGYAGGDQGFFVHQPGIAAFGATWSFDGITVYDDSWHHAALTYSAGGLPHMTLYCDGIPKNFGDPGTYWTGDTVFFETPTNSVVRIGGRDTTGPGQVFNGLMDDLQIYDTTLTPEQIKFLFDNPGSVNPPLHTGQTFYTPKPSFARTNHLVSTTVFTWYTSYGGQLSGEWRPLEGRTNWTGYVNFWKPQIKQMMMANIDMLNVHLVQPLSGIEEPRKNLFQALNELRSEGYDVPKVAPFLDPQIIWGGNTPVNLATTAGKDELVNHYIRFFNQYYSVNQDPYADDYLTRFTNAVVLDSYVIPGEVQNLSSLSRADVSNRLVAAFPSHPVFTNGFYQITSIAGSTFGFVNEKVYQFESLGYYQSNYFNGIGTVKLNGGYWDQNIRNPGAILKRDGGWHYTNAWNMVNAATNVLDLLRTNTLRRVYVESWNEYDEGSGIYAANTGPPYILPGSGNTNTDVWSSANDPYEYIRTTARGAAIFNDVSNHNAKILWHNIPTIMARGETRMATVIVRNEGDASWTAAANYKFSQRGADVSFGPSPYLIDDSQDEIPIYGGIFRGRPKTFQLTLTAPTSTNTYATHWRMLQGTNEFGEELSIPITVILAWPVVQSATPVGSDICQDAGILVTLKDRDTHVNTNSIQLSFDGAPVTPAISKAADVTTIQYDPPGSLASGSSHSYTLIYSDDAAPPASFTNTFDFVIAPPPPPAPNPEAWPPTSDPNKRVHFVFTDAPLAPLSANWIADELIIHNSGDQGDQGNTAITIGGHTGVKVNFNNFLNIADKSYQYWADYDTIDILMQVYGDAGLLLNSQPHNYNFLIGQLPDLTAPNGGSIPVASQNLRWNWFLFRIPNPVRDDGSRYVGSIKAGAEGNTAYGGVNGGTIRVDGYSGLTVRCIAFGERGAFGEPNQINLFLPPIPSVILTNIKLQNSDVVVTWNASCAVRYTLQFVDSLSPTPVWNDVPGAVNLPGPTSPPYILKGTHLGGANGTKRFYRVKIESP